MDDHMSKHEPEPTEVSTCRDCPDDDGAIEQDALSALESLREHILDPHLPERDDAVKIARNAYPHLGGNQEFYDPGQPPDDGGHIAMQWVGKMTVEKYHGKIKPGDTPYEVIEGEPNLLVNAGINIILDLLIGAGGTVFNNANSHIGVGDSSTAAAAAQTDLQAATNKFREPMDSTFPSRSGQVLPFKATFETTDANFAWNEWGVFNNLSTGTMLNRKVQSFGTKTSADTWVATVTVTLTGT